MHWVMVDLETTGLNPAYHDIIEVGCVNNEGRELAFSLGFDESRAHPRALRVNKYYSRLLDGTMAPHITHKEAIEVIDDFFSPNLEGEEPYIVAWPAKFDVEFLEQFYHRHQVNWPWHYRRVIDVRSFASGLLGVGCDLTDERIEANWGIKRSDFPEHTALGDARFQAEVFKILLEGAENRRVR